MKTYPLTLLQIGLLSGTRAIAAIGLALLCAGKLTEDQRKPAGWSLFGFGSILYIVMILDLVLRNRPVPPPPPQP